AVAGEDGGVDQEGARRCQDLVVEAGDHPGSSDHVVALDTGHPHGEAENEELLARADVALLHHRYEGHVGRAEVAELHARLEEDAGVNEDDRHVDPLVRWTGPALPPAPRRRRAARPAPPPL